MKLRIPFHYSISFVPYRHQNRQVHIGSATTEVDIGEISGVDAPVAFRVGNLPDAGGYGYAERMFDRKGDGTMRAIRVHDGKLYVEAGSAEGLQGSVLDRLDRTVFAPCGSKLSRANGQTRTDWTIEEIQRRHPQPLRSFSDDKGRSVAELLARRALQLRIIDGVVYQRCAEPILKVDSVRPRATIAPRPSPGRMYDHDPLDVYGSGGYGFDEHENLVSAHRLLGAKREKPIEIAAAWEVIDPSLSYFDGTAYDVTHMADYALRGLVGCASGLPREALDAMYVLREALEDAAGRATPRLAEALALVASLDRDLIDHSRLQKILSRHGRMRADGYHSHTRSVTKDRHSVFHENKMHSAVRKAKDAVNRWDVRPADGWELAAPATSSLANERGACRQLLSPGQVIDACHGIGVDPGPVLEAARNGRPIFEISRGGYRASRKTDCLAIVTGDDDLTLVGKVDDGLASGLVRVLLGAAERASDIGFDVVPMK